MESNNLNDSDDQNSNDEYYDASDCYYAVRVPRKYRLSKHFAGVQKMISTDKDIIKMIKEYPGSRFKTFTDFKDALKFVLDVDEEENNSTSTSVVEIQPPYPSLSVINLNEFKRAIMAKQLDKVQKWISQNPRYLISNYFDSPTIIVQGARYNAVHLAIRSRSPEILEYILEKISSLDFTQLMNPNFTQESLIEKRDHILDLYLNSPDKVFCFTPLHMACKFGDLSCVKILVGYIPVLDVKKLDKKGRLPEDLVDDPQLRQEIIELINSSVFITITKSKENLNKQVSKVSNVGWKILESKLNSQLTENVKNEVQVSAIVGPMTKEKSETIYEVCRSPQKCTPKQRLIRLEDPERGLERVVHEISTDFNLPYCEYWSFLNDFASFSTEKDLEKLNDFLSESKTFKYIDNLLTKFGEFSLNGHSIEQKESENKDENFMEKKSLNFDQPVGGCSFINGSQIERIDQDVYDRIKMALDNGQLVLFNYDSSFNNNEKQDGKIDKDQDKSLEQMNIIKHRYPFVYRWMENVSETRMLEHNKTV